MGACRHRSPRPANRKGRASALPSRAAPKDHSALPKAGVKAQPERLICLPSRRQRAPPPHTSHPKGPSLGLYSLHAHHAWGVSTKFFQLIPSKPLTTTIETTQPARIEPEIKQSSGEAGKSPKAPGQRPFILSKFSIQRLPNHRQDPPSFQPFKAQRSAPMPRTPSPTGRRPTAMAAQSARTPPTSARNPCVLTFLALTPMDARFYAYPPPRNPHIPNLFPARYRQGVGGYPPAPHFQKLEPRVPVLGVTSCGCRFTVRREREP
jgi:hypothetical protein